MDSRYVRLLEAIRHEMDELHDRVMKLRDVVPPEPTTARPWWKFWGG